MAKEFKEFDKKFSAAEIRGQRELWLVADDNYVASISKWKYADIIVSWHNAFIRDAVYMCDSAEEWQMFRVSLKGLTTREKLSMLERRCHFFLTEDETATTTYETICDKQVSRHTIEHCRIDNYIGALVRGGQLAVGTYEVLK